MTKFRRSWAVFAVVFVLGLAADAPGRPEDAAAGGDVYLKRRGIAWVWVSRGQAGMAHRLGPASEPRARQASSALAAAGTGRFLPYQAYPTSSWPEAVAVGDLNGDGRNDIAMVTSFYFDAANDDMLHVWLQNPDGTLATRVKYPLGENPQSVAIGDVNGDGLNDVVAAIGTGIGVLTQNVPGRLDPMVLYPTSDSLRVKIADLDNDGRLDVVGIGWGTDTASVLRQGINGTLAAPVVYSVPHAGYDDLEVGDVNGDGLSDVVVMSGQAYAVPNFSVLYQQANGTLGGLTSRNVGTNQLAGGIGVGDVTGEGRNDVVVAMNWAGGGTPSIAVFPQLANGTLPLTPSAVLPTYSYPEPLEVGDVTGDGRADVVLFDDSVMIGVYPQLPGGQLGGEELYPFPYATHLNRHGIAIGDVNGDGRNDVVAANYNYGLVVLLHAPPQVSVTAPMGQILTGVPVTVSWSPSDDPFASFDVSYSTDGGQKFTAIPGCSGLPAAARSCQWPSPGPATNEGRIRVVGSDGSGRVLASGINSLVIADPFVSVTSPNTAVRWVPGTTGVIGWSSNLAGAPVRIELSRNGGATWSTLLNNAPSPAYPWTVSGPSTASALVRVTWVDNAAVTDVSDVAFTIDTAPVASAGPDRAVELGGSALLDGSASFDADGDPVTFEWTDGHGAQIGTTAQVSIVPPLGASTYTLTVRDAFGGAASDTVGVTATDTTPPSVVLVAPPAGRSLAAGVPVTLEWTAADNGALVRFDLSLSSDGVTYADLPGCVGLPGSARSCSWTPLAAAGAIFVRVLGRDASGNAGSGGASFSISMPFVVVTSPAGGFWRAGSVQTIRWSHNLGTAASVKIELSRDGGKTWSLIAPSTPPSDAYEWTVSGPSTFRARIRVTWVADSAVTDTSDRFTIFGR